MPTYTYQQQTPSDITVSDINDMITGTISSFSIKSKNIAELSCDESDEPEATEFLSDKGWDIVSEDPMERVSTLFEAYIPLSGVSDNQFPFLGEYEDEQTGEIGDWSGPISLRNHKAFIRVNSITTGGDLVIGGTSVNPFTGVHAVSDTETITLDTTSSVYLSSKTWTEIDSIDVSSGSITGINYDFGSLSLYDGFNTDFKMLGYRIDMRSQGNDPDIGFRIRKFTPDPATKKVSILTLEDIGWDSTGSNGQVIDSLRTAGSDRSFTFSDEAWDNNRQFTHKQFDFDFYFSSGQNRIMGTQGEGILIDFVGAPSGGISNVDNAVLTLIFRS